MLTPDWEEVLEDDEDDDGADQWGGILGHFYT